MKPNTALKPILSAAALILILVSGARATTEQVLHSFGTFAGDGMAPQANVTLDAAGNIYGSTGGGGTHNFGTIFQLVPNGSGGWTENVLWNFTGGADGAFPITTMTFDSLGNLYGTATAGGDLNSCPGGCGVVFELSPSQGGTWNETTLYSFKGTDGREPHGDVVFDANGNLLGTTRVGGQNNLGVVFELTPSGNSWTEQVLHQFAGGTDDSYPTAGLTFDFHGNLFGMTTGGVGSVFKLTHSRTGRWHYKSLFCFCNVGAVGDLPQGKVALDTHGHLYGATYGGGANGAGVVFELSHTTSGWVETPLYPFAGTSDGANPGGGLVRDTLNRFFGTTQRGGTNNGGVAYKLELVSHVWTQTVLHDFPSTSDDGVIPLSGMTFDAAGNLYGTTFEGGTAGSGTVFELTP